MSEQTKNIELFAGLSALTNSLLVLGPTKNNIHVVAFAGTDSDH